MPDLEIIATSDGSHTLRNLSLRETYHSIHGAVQESNHVFITNGLVFFESKNHSHEIRILEVGFGTGLNALLTMQRALESKAQFHYTSIDVFPLSMEIVQQLNYPHVLKQAGATSHFHRLHTAPWMQEDLILKNFILKKRQESLQEADLGRENFDLIYFDAFAPSRQPDLWELPMLAKVERSMKPGGIFVTYCAKGQLKRDLRSLGLTVETLAGPPGKKEMVRALKS